MAGTNLLSVADKVLPTIIGVVSFLGALLIVILYFQGNPAWKTVFLSAIILSVPWNIHRGMFGDKLKVKYDKFFDYPKARNFAKEDLFALIDCESVDKKD